MAILYGLPNSAVSHSRVRGYRDTNSKVACGLLAILEFLPQAIILQQVAKSLSIGHPGFFDDPREVLRLFTKARAFLECFSWPGEVEFSFGHNSLFDLATWQKRGDLAWDKTE